MKQKLSFKEYIYVASMLFGMFFGAGNLIFPVYMGQVAGRNMWAAVLGFLITGVGITLYTNNPPYEPRERDYALVTSFWTFGVWIGLGVLALYTWLKKYVAQRQKLALSVGISAICLLAVPVLMACQN